MPQPQFVGRATDKDPRAFFVYFTANEVGPKAENIMKHFLLNFHFLACLSRFLFLAIAFTVPLSSVAKYIDATHYQFCVMDDDEIYDEAYMSAIGVSTSDLLGTEWYQEYSSSSLLIDGTKTKLTTQYGSTYVNVLMAAPGNNLKLYHYWKYCSGGAVVGSRTTTIYITINAPNGIKFTNSTIDKMLPNEVVNLTTAMTGTWTSFSGNGYFQRIYSSSDSSVATVSSDGKVTAHSAGKATITVKAYAKNRKYTQKSYYIGSASIDIEVVENLDATAISLSQTDVLTHVGESTTIEANITPEGSRSTVSWSSSDNSVATVDNGKITGKGRGNAVIEAKTSNGLSAKCYVTVLGDEDYRQVKIGDLYYDLDRNNMTATVVHEIDFANAEEDVYFDEDQCNYIQGDVIVPSIVTWYDRDFKVTTIGAHAFNQCDITSIQLPNTLATIEFSAFYKTLLTNVVIPEGVVSIGEGCFMYCPLENISLPTTLKKIADLCFYSTTSLLDIELPSTIEEIDALAFENSGLESIFIPAATKKIGAGAFSRCKNMKAIYVDSENTNYTVFNDCLYTHDLKTLMCVPVSLSEIVFAEETEEVYNMASSGNNNIEHLILPAKLVYVRNGAFDECYNLKDITFNNSLQLIEGSAFAECSSLTQLNLPESLLEIENYAFFWCWNIKTINFGSKLKVIGEDAFDSVNPEKIFIKAVMPPTIEDNTFSEYDAKLIVPTGRVQVYSKASGWSKFNTITDKDDAGIDAVLVDEEDCSKEIYDTRGIFISTTTDNLAPGVYIVRQGATVTKIVVK